MDEVDTWLGKQGHPAGYLNQEKRIEPFQVWQFYNLKVYLTVLQRIVIFRRIRIRIIFVNTVFDEYEYEYYSASGKIFEYI